MADISTPGAPLLPRVTDLRETSVAVAVAVARAAAAEGMASAALDADLPGPGAGADVGAALPPGQSGLIRKPDGITLACPIQLTVLIATHIMTQAASRG